MAQVYKNPLAQAQNLNLEDEIARKIGDLGVHPDHTLGLTQDVIDYYDLYGEEENDDNIIIPKIREKLNNKYNIGSANFDDVINTIVKGYYK